MRFFLNKIESNMFFIVSKIAIFIRLGSKSSLNYFNTNCLIFIENFILIPCCPPFSFEC